jgi:hypothetical protein
MPQVFAQGKRIREILVSTGGEGEEEREGIST